MGIIGEKRRFESVEQSFVVGKSENDRSEKVVETSAEGNDILFSLFTVFLIDCVFHIGCN